MSAISNFDVMAAARRINEGNRRDGERCAERREAARVEARRLAADLRTRDPSIRAIWGFGSAFEVSRPFTMDSDIDLALEGGDVLKLFSATEGSAFKVDLIDISDREDDFARGIRERGTAL